MKSKAKLFLWYLISWVAYLLIALMRLTFRLEEEDLPELVRERFREGKPVVFAHFHEDDWPMIVHYYYRPMIVLVSMSKDGSLLSLFLKRLGYRIARGSSSRGSVQGFKNLLRLCRESGLLQVALAVDGPRGPRRKIKRGVLKLAEHLESPVVFGVAECQGCAVAEKSWAKTIIPKPFARIRLRYVVAMNAEELSEMITSKREKEAVELMETRLKESIPHLR